MVMCVGSREYHSGYRPRTRPPFHRPSSIVYFPSQDAITASVIPRGISMWGNSAKRKLDVAQEEETSQNYFEQRQSILNISMIKLRTQPIRKVEQPLRRSVLIFNTLKQIETELKVEGVRMNLPTTPSLLPALEPSQDDTLDAIPADTTHGEHKVLGGERLGCSGPSRGLVAMDTTSSVPLRGVGDGAVVAPSTDSMFSDGRGIDSLFSMSGSQQGPLPTFSSLLDLDSCTPSSSSSSTSSLLPESSSSPFCISSSPNLPASMSSPSLSLSSTTAASSLSSGCVSQHSTSSSPSPAHSFPIACPSSASSQPLTQLSGHCQAIFRSLSPSSTSATTTATTTPEADLLSEFDFSALDMEFFPYLPSGLKLPSLSPEDLQSLPHAEAFPPALPASCNPKHSDLLTDDLDSIMQILVGI